MAREAFVTLGLRVVVPPRETELPPRPLALSPFVAAAMAAAAPPRPPREPGPPPLPRPRPLFTVPSALETI